MFAVKVAAVLWAGANFYVDPDPPHKHYKVLRPGWQGVVLDKHGPPRRANFSINYVFHTVPGVHPEPRKVSHGGYSPVTADADVFCANKYNGFVARLESKCRVRYIGKKVDGWLLPVTDIKLYSDDLPQHMLPKIVTPAKPGT